MSKSRTKRRKRRGGEGGKKRGGVMMGMRGSFKNLASSVAGADKPRTRKGAVLSTLVTIALLIAAAALLLNKYM
jgi:hypothetical protein